MALIAEYATLKGGIFVTSVQFSEYLTRMDEVEGWFDPLDALAISECLAIQHEEGITGSLAEIGVHHGKSFLSLALADKDGDRLFAIDVFERQDLNVDRSGMGSRSAFLENCKKFAPSAKVSILAMSSLDLKGQEHELLSPLRFLSIDGGHTRDITLNDLEIANTILVDGGMCCTDDVLHPEWTGVVSGIFAFMENNSNLVPFALTPKKLYWCRPEYHEMRRKRFRSAFSDNLRRVDTEFGENLVDFYCR